MTFYFNPAEPEDLTAGAADDVILLRPMGFDHRVARIASQG